MFVKDNLVRSTRAYFYKKLENEFSQRELRYLFNKCLIHRLKLSSAELILADERSLSESDLLFFREVANRLLTHEPIQQILHTADFYGLELCVNEHTLIPRPETEELVDWIVSEVDASKPSKILDLCTGTGCIALALKSSLKSAEVAALDVSEEAIKVASKNSKELKLDIAILQLDVLSQLSELEGTYDVWVSNPPYVLESDKKEMHPNVLKFEPHLALFVEDEEALIFYQKIAREALSKLNPGGLLFFEIHENKGAETVQLLEDLGFVNIELRKDLQGRDRMVKGQKS